MCCNWNSVCSEKGWKINCLRIIDSQQQVQSDDTTSVEQKGHFFNTKFNVHQVKMRYPQEHGTIWIQNAYQLASHIKCEHNDVFVIVSCNYSFLTVPYVVKSVYQPIRARNMILSPKYIKICIGLNTLTWKLLKLPMEQIGFKFGWKWQQTILISL